MKKLILIMILFTLIPFFAKAQDHRCDTTCQLVPQECLLRPPVFNIGSCVIRCDYQITQCAGPPEIINIQILNLRFEYPYCDCSNLTLAQILPAAFDYIINHDFWLIPRMYTIPLDTCITNYRLNTSVCWEKDPQGWTACYPPSCCIRNFDICKDSCGIIHSYPQSAITVIPCDSLELGGACNFIFCE